MKTTKQDKFAVKTAVDHIDRAILELKNCSEGLKLLFELK